MRSIAILAVLGLGLAMAHEQPAPTYDALIQQGKTQLQAGDSAGALATGRQAIQLDGNRWEAYALAGGALMNLKRYDEAIDDLSKAIDHAPADKQPALRDLRKQCVLAESGAAPPPAQPSASAPTQPAPATQAEIVLWKTIENSNNADDYNAYLRQFPRGAFVALVNAKLEQMAWNPIQNSTNPADFTTFLSQYPNGNFAARAKRRISDLQVQQEQAAVVSEQRDAFRQQQVIAFKRFRATISAQLSNAPTTWTDPVTGLMWERPIIELQKIDGLGTDTDLFNNSVTSGFVDYEDKNLQRGYAVASARCANLRVQGFSDWRLPTEQEVTNLLNGDHKLYRLKGIDFSSILIDTNMKSIGNFVTDHINPAVIEIFSFLMTSTPGKKSNEHIIIFWSTVPYVPFPKIVEGSVRVEPASRADGSEWPSQCVRN